MGVLSVGIAEPTLEPNSPIASPGRSSPGKRTAEHIPSPDHAVSIASSEHFDKAGLVEAQLAALHDAQVLEMGLQVSEYTSMAEGESPSLPSVGGKSGSVALKPIRVRELKLGKVHRGRVLTGTLCCESVKLIAVVNVLEEDGSGDATKIVISNAVPRSSTLARAQQLYPKGAKISVRDPYLKRFSDGMIGIFLDSPAMLEFNWLPRDLYENGDHDCETVSRSTHWVNGPVSRFYLEATSSPRATEHGSTDLVFQTPDGFSPGRVFNNYRVSPNVDLPRHGSSPFTKTTSPERSYFTGTTVNRGLQSVPTGDMRGEQRLQDPQARSFDRAGTPEDGDVECDLWSSKKVDQRCSDYMRNLGNGKEVRHSSESELEEHYCLSMRKSVSISRLNQEEGVLESNLANSWVDRVEFDKHVIEESLEANVDLDKGTEEGILDGYTGAELVSSEGSADISCQWAVGEDEIKDVCSGKSFRKQTLSQESDSTPSVRRTEINSGAVQGLENWEQSFTKPIELSESKFEERSDRKETHSEGTRLDLEYEQNKESVYHGKTESCQRKMDSSLDGAPGNAAAEIGSGEGLEGTNGSKELSMEISSWHTLEGESDVDKLTKNLKASFVEQTEVEIEYTILKTDQQTTDSSTTDSLLYGSGGELVAKDHKAEDLLESYSSGVECRTVSLGLITQDIEGSFEDDSDPKISHLLVESAQFSASERLPSVLIKEFELSNTPQEGNEDIGAQGVDFSEEHSLQESPVDRYEKLKCGEGIVEETQAIVEDSKSQVYSTDVPALSEFEGFREHVHERAEGNAEGNVEVERNTISGPGEQVEPETVMTTICSGGLSEAPVKSMNRMSEESSRSSFDGVDSDCQPTVQDDIQEISKAKFSNGLNSSSNDCEPEIQRHTSSAQATMDEQNEISVVEPEFRPWKAATKEIDWEHLTASALRMEGNRLFAQKDWNGAVDLYTVAILRAIQETKSGQTPPEHPVSSNSVLDGDEPESEVVMDYSNRAETWLRLYHYERAWADAERALSVDPTHLKSLFRKGRALLGLGEYQRALAHLEAAYARAPFDRDLVSAIQLSRIGDHQSRLGIFDMSDYYLRGRFVGDVPLCADYVGPVRVAFSGEGRGRGLFLTKNVKAGELLLVSNPLAFVESKPESGVKGKRNLLDGNAKGRFGVEVGHELVSALRERTQVSNRNCLRLLSLCHGDAALQVPSMDLFTPGPIPPHETGKLDEARVRRIVSQNVIDKNMVSSGPDRKTRSGRGDSEDLEERTFYGLWALPSFMNHSCLPNVSIVAVGRALFVFASRELSAGEELTSSYFNIFQPLVKRRELSSRCWGFTCDCARCVLESQHESSLRRLYLLHSRLEPHPAWVLQIPPFTYKVSEKEISKELEVVELSKKLGVLEKAWLRASVVQLYLVNRQFQSGHGTHPYLESALDMMQLVGPGCRCTLEVAILARDAARKEYHGTRTQHYKNLSHRVLQICECIFGKQKASIVQSIIDELSDALKSS